MNKLRIEAMHTTRWKMAEVPGIAATLQIVVLIHVAVTSRASMAMWMDWLVLILAFMNAPAMALRMCTITLWQLYGYDKDAYGRPHVWAKHNSLYWLAVFTMAFGTASACVFELGSIGIDVILLTRVGRLMLSVLIADTLLALSLGRAVWLDVKDYQKWARYELEYESDEAAKLLSKDMKLRDRLKAFQEYIRIRQRAMDAELSDENEAEVERQQEMAQAVLEDIRRADVAGAGAGRVHSE